MPEIHSLAWPISRLGELIEQIAVKGKLYPEPVLLPKPPDYLVELGDQAIGRWLNKAGSYLDIEAEAVQFLFAETNSFVQTAGPAVLRLPGELSADRPRFLGIIKGGARRVTVLGPDLKARRVPLSTIRTVLVEPLEAPLVDGIQRLLDQAEVPLERQRHARETILNEQLGATPIQGGWMLRLSPGSNLWKQFRHARLVRPLLALFGWFFFQQALFILSWWIIGQGIFQGHFDMGWIAGWAILLFAGVPLQFMISDAQGDLSIGAGTIFKQRLLYGALRLEPEEIRHQGMGQFLGRVMESEAVELLAIGGGINAILAIIQLITAAIILSMGTIGYASVAVLLIWSLMSVFILWRYAIKTRTWTDIYREMTNDLVERMVGHRTRLAQEDRQHWHDDEDAILDRYLKYSMDLDKQGLQLNAFIARGWMAVGLAMVVYLFINTSADSAQLAVTLGGVLLASRALTQLAGGAQSLVGFWIAWRQVGPLFDAASRPRDSQAMDFIFSPEGNQYGQEDARGAALDEQTQGALVSANNLVFRYRQGSPAVLEYVNLSIDPGERILLEGPSGGGKTTLAALLAGLRLPDAGSLLLWGYDRQILGSEEWRRRVVMAPQFQENHVFAETFAFNLLMGRRWPPTSKDLEEADALCRELGLGELIDRMPSGLQQMVGENGWQLSHGERSRLFIARTLLQGADLVILDESFGALDPINLEMALRTVLKRAPTLLVIAHP